METNGSKGPTTKPAVCCQHRMSASSRERRRVTGHNLPSGNVEARWFLTAV